MSGPGGKRAGAGRKRLGDEPMRPRAIRMTDAEWEKLLRLGGSEWIRARIKRARS